MDVHTALFKDLLELQFESPCKYGLDELWTGNQLKWQCADLHAGVSRHSPLLYELESSDPTASNFWELETRMVGEVNYVQLFKWIKDQPELWQDDLLLLFHDPNFASRKFHQDVSRFTVQKGLRPNSRIMYRFFTSHQPMMNEQDQVTWTNWPASKKKALAR